MKFAEAICYRHHLGPVIARYSDTGVCRLLLSKDPSGPDRPLLNPDYRVPWLEHLEKALETFFAGKREDFKNVPLDIAGATPFQKEVWAAARKIGWGETSSYGDLCALLGRQRGSARAVGRALRANPIPIIIPCHRFLGAGGDLGGFSAGPEWKKALLEAEGWKNEPATVGTAK